MKVKRTVTTTKTAIINTRLPKEGKQWFGVMDTDDNVIVALFWSSEDATEWAKATPYLTVVEVPEVK